MTEEELRDERDKVLDAIHAWRNPDPNLPPDSGFWESPEGGKLDVELKRLNRQITARRIKRQRAARINRAASGNAKGRTVGRTPLDA